MVRNRFERREQFDPDREVEQLCDIGAAEILMPQEEFRDDVAKYGFSLTAVGPLRERYEASREAVIRRMVQLDQGLSAAVFLEHRLKPSELALASQMSLNGLLTAPEPKLRIAYTATSPSFRVFLPADKSVPDTSCAYEAATTDNVAQGFEAWEISGLPPCRVEAMAMPSGDDVLAPLKVVALLRI